MKVINYFPEGIAMGEAFINRDEERSYLIKRIVANKHCVLMAPRRYGKTSLVMKVAEEMNISNCAIDFLAAYSEEYVRDQIVRKISRLVFKLLPPIAKAKETLISIFKTMNPEITIGAFGQKLSFKMSNNPLQDITDLLLKLDETAKHFKKKAVIFMDEFQQISQLKAHHSIEASIRHAVERSENITYVFSGSNRNLLKQMFADKSRPLYRLCQTINLGRMKRESYENHLQQRAKEVWKIEIPKNALETIFELTELHPFYMNVLCQIIWERPTIPSHENIEEIWKNYVTVQRQIISHDLDSLSINQRKMITTLAIKPTIEIQSAEFTSSIKISASSANQSVEALVRNDLVYRDEQQFYRVLDPAMKYYLAIVLQEK